jgi:hypothetical protein
MSASAIVTVTLRVTLSQPWSDEHKVGDVITQASKEAKDIVYNLIQAQSNVDISKPIKVKVIYEEGR